MSRRNQLLNTHVVCGEWELHQELHPALPSSTLVQRPQFRTEQC